MKASLGVCVLIVVDKNQLEDNTSSEEGGRVISPACSTIHY